MFCLWGRTFVNSSREKSLSALLHSHKLLRKSLSDQGYCKRQLEFPISFDIIYISKESLELSNWGFSTFKIWMCFGCYSLEANILLWFILGVTHFLHFQALVWWLVGDCSASLKMHDVSLVVFFFSCWKIFYSFLRRKEFSKWRPISKRYPV